LGGGAFSHERSPPEATSASLGPSETRSELFGPFQDSGNPLLSQGLAFALQGNGCSELDRHSLLRVAGGDLPTILS